MLGKFRKHKNYQEFVIENLRKIDDSNSLFEYETEISKLYILNLDKLLKIIAPLYSNTGRPSNFQPEIFRSFLLMNLLKLPLDKWLHKLKYNKILQIIVGVTCENIPCASSHYDFINRLIKIDEHSKIKVKKLKPTKKLGKNQKIPNKHPNIVEKLVNKILCGRSFSNRPEKTLQEIFARTIVDSSLELGLISQNLDVSGDGTCIKTGASCYGMKICDCKSNGIYKCDCSRRYSDPNATWGFDSSKNQYFYGYTGYFLSTYNSDLKLDLPLSIRIVEASRNDSVTAVVSLNEFRELYPNLTMNTFIHDTACDNYATYKLLDSWNINAIIPLNPTSLGKFTYPNSLYLNENGVPVCLNNIPMINWGFNKKRCRTKYRCPLALGRISHCEHKSICSKSAYGRTIYTKPSWDIRLFTRIPRGSDCWKQKMRYRTSIERLNNRFLNNYGIQFLKNRGKKRLSFFTMIAGFNIHLDAWLSFLRLNSDFNFKNLFINDLIT